VIEDQQSSAPEGAEEGAEEGAAAAAAVVLSKVVYDDGDVEILDLVGGAEKVVLVARADGAPTGDGDRDYLSDSDDDDDGAAAAGGAPLSRRASARAGNDAGLPLSRRAEAKEAAAREARRARLGGGGDADDDDDDGDGGGGGPRRAPGAPGPSLAAVRARDDADAIRAGLRRNPARAAAVAAFGGDDDDLPPPSDERVGAVLEAMKSNDVARVLSELPFAHEESSEVYKLGYAMGARRAIAVCAAVVAAAAARAGAGAGEAAADAATAKKRKLSGGRAGGGDESGGAGAGAGASPPPSGGGRVRKKSARAAAWEEDKEKAAAKAKAAAGEEKKTDGSPGGDEEAEVKDEAAKKRADDVAEADVKLGAALASRAKRPHGAWEDALSAAARDPALTAVLARVERVLEKETFDPDVGDSDDDDADADGWTRGIDAGAVADKTREGINANVVRGVLGVTAAFETARGWRGSAAAIAASKAIFAPPAPAPAPGAAVGAPPSASRPSPNTPKNTPNDPPPNPKPPSRASALDPAALAAKAANAPPAAKAAAAASMGAKIEPPPTGVVSAAGGEHVAAAYEEAAAKRLAAEAELARIADPVKLAFVQDDATKPKPTTTAGRLIKGAFYTLVPIRPRWRGERRSLRTFAVASLRPGSLAFNARPRRLSTSTDAFQLHPDNRSYGTTLKAANNAKARAERVAAGGGTFRSRGASGGQYGGGGGGAGRGPGRPPSAAAAAVAKRVKPTDPAKAAFMEQTGPSGLGAKAFEFRPPLAPTATAAAAEAFERAAAAGGGGDDADAMDCALSLDGDDGVTRWLTRRGWGEYAAGFASYGVTMETLPGLSMQDMENMPAFMSPEMRAKVHAAAVAVGTKRGGAGAGTAGAKSPPKRKATATATATAAKSAAEKDGAKVASPSRSRKSPSASPAKRQRGSESRSIHSGLSG
jgi:hypothetical protein